MARSRGEASREKKISLSVLSWSTAATLSEQERRRKVTFGVEVGANGWGIAFLNGIARPNGHYGMPEELCWLSHLRNSSRVIVEIRMLPSSPAFPLSTLNPLIQEPSHGQHSSVREKSVGQESPAPAGARVVLRALCAQPGPAGQHTEESQWESEAPVSGNGVIPGASLAASVQLKACSRCRAAPCEQEEPCCVWIRLTSHPQPWVPSGRV